MVLKVSLNTGINRIRLEFKVTLNLSGNAFPSVLIESDWNLKTKPFYTGVNVRLVLIESDWNLKGGRSVDKAPSAVCINRIRLEFKGYTTASL